MFEKENKHVPYSTTDHVQKQVACHLVQQYNYRTWISASDSTSGILVLLPPRSAKQLSCRKSINLVSR